MWNVGVFLHSLQVSLTDSLESSGESLISNQTSVQASVQSDNEQSKLTITSCTERRAKSIPISKTRIQQKQRQEQLPRCQYQGMLHKDISSEDKFIRDVITKNESISHPNLKQIGKGPPNLAFYKRRHLNQDPVLIQARQGLNKTRKAENPGSNLILDKAKSKINHALLKKTKGKDVTGGETFQSKSQMAKFEAGDQTSCQSNPSYDRQLKPSSEFPKDHEESLNRSKIVAPSSSFEVLNCDPDILTCPVTGVLEGKKSEGLADVHENRKSSLLDLHTSVPETYKSTQHGKLRFTASERDTCISTVSQTKQTDCFRFPLKSSPESSHSSRICRPESGTTTSNYIHTPRQLNQPDHFPIKGRTCRRVIKGAGSFSDRKSTYLISTQARKKDLSFKETRLIGALKKDVSKLTQKVYHGSDTDSSKSNSNLTSSLGEDLRKHKRLEVEIKCGISISTQSNSTHMASNDLKQTSSPKSLCNNPYQQTHIAIPELSMGNRVLSGSDKPCVINRRLTEEDSLTVEQVSFAQLHQQDDSLLRKPSVSEARKSEQEIIPLPGIVTFKREYKPNDF